MSESYVNDAPSMTVIPYMPEESAAWAAVHDAEFQASLAEALDRYPAPKRDDRMRRSAFLAGWGLSHERFGLTTATDDDFRAEAARRGMSVVDAEQARIERDR